jgi:hypothetical protein
LYPDFLKGSKILNLNSLNPRKNSDKYPFIYIILKKQALSVIIPAPPATTFKNHRSAQPVDLHQCGRTETIEAF